MARLGRLEERLNDRWVAASASAALHVGIAMLVFFSGDRHDGIHSGDTPATKLILVEAASVDTREGVELHPFEPSAMLPQVEAPAIAFVESSNAPSEAAEEEKPAVAELVAPIEVQHAAEPAFVAEVQSVGAVPLSQKEQAEIAKRLENLADEVTASTPMQVSWRQDGREYRAVLVLERASDGMALDRVIADVSAAHHGKQFLTRVALKRLAFSSFSHVVDRWDPMVQFHDDEIVGRVHTNTPFNLFYDSRTAPEFLGKVTTAAGTFYTDSKGRRRHSEIFKGGVQTRVKRIQLPEALQPFEWAPSDERSQIYEYSSDTSIAFRPEGGFTWYTQGASAGQVDANPDEVLYLIAGRGVTLRVRGTVAGKVLVYSPHKIVVEGSLIYARDPRKTTDSPDYLGLVCDRYVEIAPPAVTGPGDLEIDAAIFAGRRFVVTNINHRRQGTLRVFGSLSVGSMSASEPRYATKIEYDERFEERRPPGFPSTDRFEIAQWNGVWTEVTDDEPERALSALE